MKKKYYIPLILFSLAVALVAVFMPHKGFDVQKYDSDRMLDSFYCEETVLSDKMRHFFENTKIELITVSKDDELYAWFGHSGIMVSYPDRPSLVYDYGNFSFEDGFYADFAVGNLWYRCCCRYAEDWINAMKARSRTISAVTLNFSPEKKMAICNFLYENAKEENCVYLYKIYTDNCSTRIRDIIDRAVNGGLKEKSKITPGYTCRQNISRMLFNCRPVMWVLDCLQSGTIDGYASRWDEMFLPQVLEDCILDFPGLAASHRYLTDFRNADSRPTDSVEPVSNDLFSLICGLVCALAVVVLSHFSGFAARLVISITDLILGLVGAVMFFMMVFTKHTYVWGDYNILYMSPVLLYMSVIIFVKKKTELCSYFHLALYVAALSVLLLKLLMPTTVVQNVWSCMLFVLPYYLAVYSSLRLSRNLYFNYSSRN